MKVHITHIIFFIFLTSCWNIKQPEINLEKEYADSNQTQFTFLVFEKLAVDSFMKLYSPLLYDNEKLKKAIADSLLIQRFDTGKIRMAEYNIARFLSNTKKPDTSMFNLAMRVIRTTSQEEGKNYFSDNLGYFFFYNCLPVKFKHKWFQTTLGHFEFNAAFFALLRERSKELDSLIYGDIGCWNKDMLALFDGYIFNEITPEVAGKIKNTILQDDAFNNILFSQDKINLLEFLDKTIEGDWRLIMIDWD